MQLGSLKFEVLLLFLDSPKAVRLSRGSPISECGCQYRKGQVRKKKEKASERREASEMHRSKIDSKEKDLDC